MKNKSTKKGQRFSTEGYKRNSPDVNNPYNIIPSGNITMKGVDFPVMGTDNLGNTKLMMPGYDYVFPGNAVFEVPMAQGGIEVPKRNGVRKNPDGSVSTHLMATETLDGKNWFSFPTLFQDPDGTWIDMSDRPWEEAYEEAKRRGEVIDFGTDKEAAIKFGEGSWKLPKAQFGYTDINQDPSQPNFNFSQASSAAVQNNLPEGLERMDPAYVNKKLSFSDKLGRAWRKGKHAVGLYSYPGEQEQQQEQQEIEDQQSIQLFGKTKAQAEDERYRNQFERIGDEFGSYMNLTSDRNVLTDIADIGTAAASKVGLISTAGALQNFKQGVQNFGNTTLAKGIDYINPFSIGANIAAGVIGGADAAARGDNKQALKKFGTSAAIGLSKGAAGKLSGVVSKPLASRAGNVLGSNTGHFIEHQATHAGQHQLLSPLLQHAYGGQLPKAQFGKGKFLKGLVPSFSPPLRQTVIHPYSRTLSPTLYADQKVYGRLPNMQAEMITRGDLVEQYNVRNNAYHTVNITDAIRNNDYLRHRAYTYGYNPDSDRDLALFLGTSPGGTGRRSHIEDNLLPEGYDILYSGNNPITTLSRYGDFSQGTPFTTKFKLFNDNTSMLSDRQLFERIQALDGTMTNRPDLRIRTFKPGDNIDDFVQGQIINTNTIGVPGLNQTNLMLGRVNVPVREPIDIRSGQQMMGWPGAYNLNTGEALGNLSTSDYDFLFKKKGGELELPKAQKGNLGRIIKSAGKTTKPGVIKTTAPVVRTAPYINTGFNSSINWAGWNPETVTHPELIEEYNAIEQLTKENNTWMKNLDGSMFAGTPEQFIQQQSSWFKNAYPQGFENTFRGTYGPLNTVRVAEVFPEGRGIFTGDINTAQHYAGSNGLLSSLYHPITSNNYSINAEGANWRNIPVQSIPGITNERIEYTGKKLASTDELAKWLELNGLDYITINNLFDGLPADYVKIINNKPGNYLKSATGNVGFFDLNNPDVFKKDGGSIPTYQDQGEVKMKPSIVSGKYKSAYEPYGGFENYSKMLAYGRYQDALKSGNQSAIDVALTMNPEFKDMSFGEARRLSRDASVLAINNENASLGQPFYNADRDQMEFTWNGKPYNITGYEEVPTQELMDFFQATGDELQQIAKKAYKAYPERSMNPVSNEQQDFRFSEPGQLKEYILNNFPEGSKERAFLNANPDAIKSLTDYWKPLREELSHIVNPNLFEFKNPENGIWYNSLTNPEEYYNARTLTPGTPEYAQAQHEKQFGYSRKKIAAAKKRYEDIAFGNLTNETSTEENSLFPTTTAVQSTIAEQTPYVNTEAAQHNMETWMAYQDYVNELPYWERPDYKPQATITEASPERRPINPNMAFLYQSAPGFTGPNGFDMERAEQFRDEAGFAGPEGLISLAAGYATGANLARVPVYGGFTLGNAADLAWGANAVTNTLPRAYNNFKEGKYLDGAYDLGIGAWELAGAPGALRSAYKSLPGAAKIFGSGNIVPTTSAGFANKYPNLNLTNEGKNFIDYVGGPALGSLPLYRPSNLFRNTPKPSQYQFNKAFNLMNQSAHSGSTFNPSGFGTNQPLLGFNDGGQLPKYQSKGQVMRSLIKPVVKPTPVISSARMIPGMVGPTAAGSFVNSSGTFAPPLQNNFQVPVYNFSVPEQNSANIGKGFKNLIRPVFNKVDNLIYGANTPEIQIPKQLSGNFTDFSDVITSRAGNKTAFKNQIQLSPIKDHQLTLKYLNFLGEAADPLDNLLAERIMDLKSPVGFDRLVQQELEYQRSLPGWPTDNPSLLKSWAEKAAEARIKELEATTNINRNALNILEENIAHSGAPGVRPLIDQKLLFDNAFFRPNHYASIEDTWPDKSFVPNQNQFNIAKLPPLGMKVFPGSIGMGVPYRNSIPVMAHEIGHGLQRKRQLQIDKDAISLLKPKENLTELEQGYYNYFKNSGKNYSGSHSLEPTGFLNELREAMLQRGIITSRYQQITPELLQQAYQSFDSKPMGVFVANSKFGPGNRGNLMSNTRIFNFMDPTPDNFNNLSGLLNRLPAIGIGVGLGASALSEEDEKRYGGPLLKAQNLGEFDWRKSMQNELRTVAQDNTRVAQNIIPVEFRKPAPPKESLNFNIPSVYEPIKRIENPSDTDATFVARSMVDPAMVPKMLEDISVNSREFYIPNIENQFSEAAYEQQERELKEKAKPKDYKNASPEEVINLQKSLVSQGYSVGRTGIDGKYGSNTHDAYTNSISDDAVDLTTIDRYYNKYKEYGPDQRVIDIQKDLVEAKLLTEDQIDGKFGPITRDAVKRYNSGERESLDFSPTPSKIFDTRCAAGMCQILEGEEIPTNQLGIKHKDAWDIFENMNAKGASKSIYNIYENPVFNEVSTASELISATKAAKKDSQTTADMYKVGDIVGLFYRPSTHHEETLNSKTHNTHVGWVHSKENGVPIIAHNIGGKIYKQPYTELVTTWIQRPNKNVLAQSTAYRGQDLRYNTSDSAEHSIPNLDNLINNAETKIERKLTEQERSIVGNTIKRANYSANKLVNILNSDVDPKWVEEAVFGITGAESGMGINANRSVDEVRENDSLRSVYYDITDKKDEDISLGITKTKYSALDDFSKSYFNIQSPSDLGDDNKNIDVTTYNVIKAYEILSDYAEEFPEFGLTEQDIRNMTILAHNQGLYSLLFTGRSPNRSDMNYEDEIKLLRELYSGTVKDVTSTNWRVFGDNAVTRAMIDPKETYISKVNRYRNEVYGNGSVENQNDQQQNSVFKSGGEFKIYKNYIEGLYFGTPKEKEAEKIYDKLNRVYYKDAKQSGTTVPNYILTQVIKQTDN